MVESLPAPLQEFIKLMEEHFQKESSNLTPTMMLCLLICGAALALIPQLWRWTSYLETVIHESGHALAALTVLSRLNGIKIRRDRSGETQSIGRRFLPFQIWTTWWGYPFPSIAGALYLWSVHEGLQGAALTFTLLLMIVLVLNIRSIVAFLAIGVSAVGVWCAWWYMPFTYVAPLLTIIGSFLLIAGVKGCINLTQHHLKGNTENSDAQFLKDMTYIIPGYFWVFTFWMGTLAALAFTVKIYLWG